MNRIAMLQEMGISAWISRDGESHVTQNNAQLESEKASNLEMQITEKSNLAKVGKDNQTYVHEVDLASALEMKWVLVLDSTAIDSQIFSKIKRAIEDLGVKSYLLDISSGNFTPEEIQGDIALAFGQKAGIMLTGERDSIENLRGIVFEVQNNKGDEIPLVVTHHPLDLLKQPNLKSLVWDDILWARSIWLESRL